MRHPITKTRAQIEREKLQRDMAEYEKRNAVEVLPGFTEIQPKPRRRGPQTPDVAPHLWRQMPGFPLYLINAGGEVWSTKSKGQFLTLSGVPPRARLYRGGRQRAFYQRQLARMFQHICTTQQENT